MPYFRIDNDIFSLRLDSYAFQVYAYLVSCAGKKGECWPSTNTIARVLGMSQSTVISKIESLVRRQLIDKLTTIRHSKSGKARPAFSLLARAGNQVSVDLKLVGVQVQEEDVVVDFEVGGGHEIPFALRE